MYAACTMQKLSIIDEFISRALQHSIMGVAERERESQIFSFVAERDREQFTATSSLKFHRLI